VSSRLLVAGVGNIFFSDDGFGSEVARALAGDRIDGVRIEDFGIAGLHLGYELLAGYERAILIDLARRGGAPGTLYVIEPDLTIAGPPPDAHRMDLQNVFAFVRTLGGNPPPMEIVGCEPFDVGEGIGLSEPVAAALEPALALVRRRIAHALAQLPAPSNPEGETTCIEA
jgi:hydrogenase maturation protease